MRAAAAFSKIVGLPPALAGEFGDLRTVSEQKAGDGYAWNVNESSDG